MLLYVWLAPEESPLRRSRINDNYPSSLIVVPWVLIIPERHRINSFCV